MVKAAAGVLETWGTSGRVRALPPLSESRPITPTRPSLEADTRMLAGDYNGWADVPEDEREALDALDVTIARRLERRRHGRVAAPAAQTGLFARPDVLAAAA